MAITYPETVDTTPERDTDEEEGYWTLSKLKRACMDYLGSKHDEIAEQKNSRCYRHGAQWTVDQVEVFNKRKQPVVTFNRIGRKIDSIIGLMEKLKQDPKAYPRNPRQTDEMGAELATATVRYVLESGLREYLFPFAIENGAVDGIGGVEMMLVKGDQGDTDIGFALVKTDSFFYDPRSFDHDFEDARYMGQWKWLEMEDAKALAPTKEIADKIESTSQSGSEFTSDPDRERRWFDVDPTHKRVRVVDLWYKHKGGWCWCLFTGGLKIDEGKGYFYNEKNEQICKYLMFSAYVDHDGDRYGFPRGLRSSQDEINQRRSKGLHELNSRRIKAEDGAFADVEVARREAVRPDGVVIYNKGFEMEFDDQARIANVEGQLKFLEDAKNEIENFGPNPALIGQGLEYKSGRAINLLQQAGIAELGPFVIGIKHWKLRLYRSIWCAVQRYWSAERYIRVTDDTGVAQLVQINGVGIDENTGLPRLVNAIGQLDVNFVLDEGPDEINMMGDAYDTLVALTAQGANIPPRVLLELAPLQGQLKRKLLALLEQKDPAVEQAKQITLTGEAAKVEETKSKTALNLATAQEKAQGGAHGIVERQMDAAMKQDEHRMKITEMGAKVQTAQATGQIKAQGEFAKLQSQREKSAQDMQLNVLKGAQSLQQSEEKHQVDLRQRAEKAKTNGAAKPEARQFGGPVSAGVPYKVGEEGEETFVPDQPGVIIPNKKTQYRARTTFYAPGASGPVGKYKDLEGPFATSRKNPETGQAIPSTLDDVRLGRAKAVTVAGDPSRYGQSVNLGPITYRSPIDGQTYTLPDVKGYVHDTGSAFQGRPDKLDIAVGDFRGWTPQQASAFVSKDPGTRDVDFSGGGGFATGPTYPRVGLDSLRPSGPPTVSAGMPLGGGFSIEGSATPKRQGLGDLTGGPFEDYAAKVIFGKQF